MQREFITNVLFCIFFCFLFFWFFETKRAQQKLEAHGQIIKYENLEHRTPSAPGCVTKIRHNGEIYRQQ